ncbi:MAG: hypothetical protein K1X89_22175 [Myxococcaceae bacterium]|nr:hypothetical protein [Myxococcaceae bacterium]
MLMLALALTLAAEPEACTFKAPKEPPSIEATVFGGVEFRVSADPAWFRCAKKSGGKLELDWSLGQGGEFAPQPPVALTSYGSRESLSQLCATPGLKQVQATLKGTGEMSKLDWSSAIIEVFCPKCPWSGADNVLALHTGTRVTPPGTFTIEATFDPGWYACAKPTGALELRFFTGATREEIVKATAPSFVVKGFEGPKVKKTFPNGPICKGKPAWLGYEFAGAGEFGVIPSKGRSIVEGSCP